MTTITCPTSTRNFGVADCSTYTITTLTGPATQFITATYFCDQNFCPYQTGTDTATWTLTCSETGSSTTLNTNLVPTIQISTGPNQTSDIPEETLHTISGSHTTVSAFVPKVIFESTGLQVLQLSKPTTGSNYLDPAYYLTVDAPTTITVTAPFSIFLKAYAVLETFTQTVDEGTLTDAMEVGTLVSAETLIGPTTYVVTVTKVYDNPAFGALFAGFDSADPQCFQQVTDNGQSAVVGHTVLLKTQVDILSEGETLTKECIDGIIGYRNTERMYTFTTAGTAYCTFGQFLAAYDNDQDELYLAPGDRCGGSCGHCELYFPEVNVYYWPPASANTACLTTNSATTITPGNSRHGLHANLRALSDVPEGVTTVVNSNGFTL